MNLTVNAEAGEVNIFGKDVSDLQSDVAVTANAITGTLNYVEDYTGFSSKVSEQDGNYLALKFTNIDPTVTSVKVGLEPSYASGLVEIIDDPDKNGVFKITDKDEQVFKVVQTDGTRTKTQTFSLSGLTTLSE